MVHPHFYHWCTHYKHIQRLPAACHYSTFNRSISPNASTALLTLKNPARYSSRGVFPPLPALTLGKQSFKQLIN
jgi:hypothetical protein